VCLTATCALPFVSAELRISALPCRMRASLSARLKASCTRCSIHAADRTVGWGSPRARRGLSETARDTLVHGVEIAAADFEIVVDAKKFLQALLQPSGRFSSFSSSSMLVGKWMRSGRGPFSGTGLEYHRIGDVVALGVACFEIVGDSMLMVRSG